jgi:hypothetical protein
MHKSKILGLDLDYVMGNLHGEFDLSETAGNLSKSCRNLRLGEDGWLEGDLKDDDGEWKTRNICLDEWFKIVDGEIMMVRDQISGSFQKIRKS